MKKRLRNSALLAGAALGALLLLGYGLAWQLLSGALGFGMILFGMPSPSGSLPIYRDRVPVDHLPIWNSLPVWNGIEGLPSSLWQQAHTSSGQADALAGALLGCATMLLLLHRSSTGADGLHARDTCRGLAVTVLLCVGFFGVMVFTCMVLPSLVALAHHPNARDFGLQEFILIGVVLNPKLWWGSALLRWACRLDMAAPQVLERAHFRG